MASTCAVVQRCRCACERVGGMSVKVSVIMPIFNEKAFLADAILSFAEQTIASSSELICIDDGSTDASSQILEGFSDALGEHIVIVR